MRTIRRLLRRGPEHLRLVGIAAIGILAFNLAFFVSAIMPIRQRVAAYEQGIASLRDEMVARESLAGAAPERPEGQLDAFYQAFPPAATLADLLEKTFQVAEANQINVGKAEYAMSASDRGRLVRYQIAMPVRAPYPQIKAFLGQVLAEIPALSLEDVSLQRQRIDDAAVQSQLTFALYLDRK